MSFLDLPYETVDLDMPNGENRKPEYLARNPLGQIPVIDDNGVILGDSNAVLTCFIKAYDDGYSWLPDAPLEAAQVQRWFSIGAGEIAYGPCAARLVRLFGAPLDWDAAKAKTDKLFAMMELALAEQDFLVGSTITAADVVGYSYVSHTPEGGISLAPYPYIRAWTERIEAHDGFVGMVRSALPNAA